MSHMLYDFSELMEGICVNERKYEDSDCIKEQEI